MTSTSRTALSLEDQIREAAYFRWLDHGCPVGDDWAHWFAAEQEITSSIGAAAKTPLEHRTMGSTPWPAANRGPAATHLKPVTPPDHRPEIVASGAPQRTRARQTTGGTRRSAHP
jgi:hypothetical protein